VVGRRRAVPTGLHGGCPGRAGATFTKNRERFEKHGLLRKLFDRVVEQALVEEWASSEDFTVDGSLIESYASMKSLRPKDSAGTRVSGGSEDDDPGNPTVSFRGERRRNETHRSLSVASTGAVSVPVRRAGT
jgi:hypothetical protein